MSSVKTSKISSSLKKLTSKYTTESSSSCEESDKEESGDISQVGMSERINCGFVCIKLF